MLHDLHETSSRFCATGTINGMQRTMRGGQYRHMEWEGSPENPPGRKRVTETAGRNEQPASQFPITHARKQAETTAAAVLRRSSSSKEMCRKVSRGACRRTLYGRQLCRVCLFVVLFLESDKNLGLGGGKKSSEASGGAAQWAKQYTAPSIQ
ncbi:hypothetical protein TESG_04352 [Trichophyton tonsurans CBS 112818]|uniref:Uncharacterized protein n=1 Tax=Trichophyton tonsurans (strain CBS 112818) TaxID=647933 RepID=F2S029_TRIT1|nr:hypothetical protein TESG_04352 [Trichophyton tonsurans CBS 112818]